MDAGRGAPNVVLAQIDHGDPNSGALEDIFDGCGSPGAVLRQQLPRRAPFPLDVDGRRVETDPCRGPYAICKHMFVDVRRRVAGCSVHAVESVPCDYSGEAKFSDSKLRGSSSVLHWGS